LQKARVLLAARDRHNPGAGGIRDKNEIRFQIEIVPTDGSNCRLGNGNFGTSLFCWQFSNGRNE
jgi:hypothetical protein